MARSCQAFGAQFAEVHIDASLRTIRVPRLVGVFGVGRVINPKLARSQLTGGMIWGLSQALLEETTYDHRLNRIVNASLGDYLVPVNADVRSVEVDFIAEDDRLRQSAWHQGSRRDRYGRGRAGYRQRRLSCHRHPRPRAADHDRKVALTAGVTRSTLGPLAPPWIQILGGGDRSQGLLDDVKCMVEVGVLDDQRWLDADHIAKLAAYPD